MLKYSIILALIPVINFSLQYYFSKKAKVLNQYKNHFTTYWGDFIFIPINFVFLYAVSGVRFDLIVTVFIFSFLGNAINHYFFCKNIQ